MSYFKTLKWEKMIDLNILISNSIGDTEAVERLKDMKEKIASGQKVDFEAKNK